MYTTDDVIKMCPHMICHIISLHSFHDIFINHYLKELEINKNQYYMLMHIFYNQSSTQSDIATACLMDRSGVSRAFSELEKNGILTREYTEENKRAYKIDITDKGKELAKFLHDKEIEWENEIASEINMSRKELLATLEKLALKSLNFDRENIDNFKY
ncbi:MarR family winged helix-turn-helix transcriptional regulator [uncultured Methanobrevibacter sp.]|uniref:MarR family winged helix-turn-helix transcriptional regulator n=1 Tax=uncultured Methanobrevibacter sp. TaxID=253161 RepID=UPI00260B144A|nr:MarR family winged helix-turn-helix transcriptional regulator [uncultured Methanobrevibacter sp.]